MKSLNLVGFYRCVYYETHLEKSEIGLIELVGDKQKSKHNNCKNFRKKQWVEVILGK